MGYFITEKIAELHNALRYFEVEAGNFKPILKLFEILFFRKTLNAIFRKACSYIDSSSIS